MFAPNRDFISGMAASAATDAYSAPPFETYCFAFSQKSECTCTRKPSVLVNGEGISSNGRFCQSSYSRGKSAFIAARRASTKDDNHEPVIQRFSSPKLGCDCPATLPPSSVETYGTTSGPVKPK